MTRPLHLAAVAALSAIGVSADYLLKRGGAWSLAAGCIIYAATGLGWAWVMQNVRLAQLGVYYAASMMLLLVALGLVFGERPTLKEGIGVAMGIGSVALLARFA